MGPPTRGGIGVALLVLGFLGFLLVLGLTSDEEQRRVAGRRERDAQPRGDRPAATGDRPRDEKQAAAPARRKRVRLEVVAARRVWVCVVDGSGNEHVGAGEWCSTAVTGRAPSALRSFRVTVGNGGGDLRIDGRAGATLRMAREPLGYSVRAVRCDRLERGPWAQRLISRGSAAACAPAS